jgi:excisionase family DNA binding protein
LLFSHPGSLSPPGDPMTVKDAARLLSLSVDTVYREVSTGRLGHARVGPTGRRIFISAEDVDDYLRRCHVAAGPRPVTIPSPRQTEIGDAIRR